MLAGRAIKGTNAMNEVLKEILDTKTVQDGNERLPLHSEMTPEEGEIISTVFSEIKPQRSLEVGLAYGVSTLYVCDALSEIGTQWDHIVIDPHQTTQWRSIGMKNIARAGHSDNVTLYEERSEIALPNLLSKGTRIQAAIIDGWNSFDHALVDFFYINKMMDVGGGIIFDDANWPSISRLVRHIDTYPCYDRFLEAGPTSFRTGVRRALAEVIPAFKRDWDTPSCVVYRKIAQDDRNWDWHEDF
jgi:predicted O-methyltransferase YrrM